MDALPPLLSRTFLLFFAGALLVACGDGGSGDTQPPAPDDAVWIASPTSSDTYSTDQDTVSLSGGAFVPAGAECTGITGSMPAGYSVTWTNSTTGASGDAGYYLGCLLQVNVIWETLPIALTLGTNTITVTARDAAGNTASDSLVVMRVADVAPPEVVSTSPVDGAIGVPVNARAVVTFNEPMDPASITTSGDITLRDRVGTYVPVTVNYASGSQSATIFPQALLAYNTLYYLTVTQGVRDAAGNTLAPVTFSFTTSGNPDTTAPTVQSVTPAADSYCAAPAGVLSATFSEDLDPATVAADSFTLRNAANETVPGSVAYTDRIATFTPTAALPLETSFTARLTTGIGDLAGNALAAPHEWTFTTVTAQQGSWSPTNIAGAPFARTDHVAVWTGSEMIVAGGLAWDSTWNRFDYTSQYGRYDPASGIWQNASDAPTGIDQKAVWTGIEMLVWGGYQAGNALSGGASFNPAASVWVALPVANAPSGRFDHTALWTGNEMIVWGGRNGTTTFGDGARYNPAARTWQAVSAAGAPSPRHGHTAVWTGSEMIIWGGTSATGAALNDGARYNPTSDTWTPVTATAAPMARFGHHAVWTGSEMVVWGGTSTTGGRYNPATDSWRTTDVVCAPTARESVPALWSGNRMLLWGPADGYEYDAASDAWKPLSTAGAPPARTGHTAVWTGTRMIVWGGYDGGALASGSMFTP